MKKTIFLVLVLALVMVMGLTAVPLSAATDQPFNYTITATGTETTTTYPDQAFNWTATISGTETTTAATPIGQKSVSCGGEYRHCDDYLYAPAGTTIVSWSKEINYTRTGGRERSVTNHGNYLHIGTYSGGERYVCGQDRREYICGEWCCEHNWLGMCERHCPEWCTAYSDRWCDRGGYYSATYYIYGETLETQTVTSTVSGTGIVNGTEGLKTIAVFTLEPPPAQSGGTVTVDNVDIVCDNTEVTINIDCDNICEVVASTGYSESNTQPWQATETGSSTVNPDEGEKFITTSTLVAPDGNTQWSATDDNPAVVVRMDGPDLYAAAFDEPRMTGYRWGSPAPGFSYANWPVFEAWIEAQIENTTGGDMYNVTASIMAHPVNAVFPDTDVSFGDIPAGDTAWSTDSFTVQVNMMNPADPDEGVFWRVEWDDAAGTHHVVENIPQSPAE